MIHINIFKYINRTKYNNTAIGIILFTEKYMRKDRDESEAGPPFKGIIV